MPYVLFDNRRLKREQAISKMGLPSPNEELLLPINSEHLSSLAWGRVLIFGSELCSHPVFSAFPPSWLYRVLLVPYEWWSSILHQGSCLPPGYSGAYLLPTSNLPSFFSFHFRNVD